VEYGQGQAAVAERRYALADRRFLVLQVPLGWNEKVGRRDAGTPPTIALRPKSGAPFEVRVTPVWGKEGGARSTGDELKGAVLKAAEELKGQAAEGLIVPVELIGPAAQGYYVKATDRAPKAGEFKYVAQGLLGLEEIRVGFTILTNDGQAGVVDAAFGMLRSARIVRGSQAAAPQAPAKAEVKTTGSVPPAGDWARLQRLLASGNVAELDDVLSARQAAYRSGAINEPEAAQGIRALNSDDPDLRPIYDRWVAEKPKSYAARVARARFLVRQGYLQRGSEYASKTSKAQFDEMRAAFAAARADLDAAATLDPKPALMYSSLISVARGLGRPEDADRALRNAIALDPRVVTARYAYLGFLEPQWGGSIQEMEAAVAEWKKVLGDELSKGLVRMVEDARWRKALQPAAALVEAKRCPEAIPLYDKALEQAPVVRAYTMRAQCYAELGQHEKAIEDYTRSLELDPESACCSGTRAGRASSYLKLGALDKGMTDLLDAATRDGNAWATAQLAVMYLEGKYGVKKDYDAARQWCERSAKKGDPLSMYCMGGLYDQGLGGPKDLKLAAYWYQRAAERGIADAQADFAFMLWDGEGVAQDRDRAVKFWRAAAKQGNARAKRRLESNLSSWDYFYKVSYPDWVAEKRESNPWLYLLLRYVGLADE
jgi:TPR repeat protein